MRRPIRTVRMRHASQIVNSGNESSHEEEIDKSAEVRVILGTPIAHKSNNRPEASQHRNNEQHQDGRGRQLVAVREAVDEPGQHADGGDEREDFGEAPSGEGETGQHVLTVVNSQLGFGERRGNLRAARGEVWWADGWKVGSLVSAALRGGCLNRDESDSDGELKDETERKRRLGFGGEEEEVVKYFSSLE